MYTVIQNVVKKLIGAFIVALDGLIHKVKGVYVVEDGVIKEVPTGESDGRRLLKLGSYSGYLDAFSLRNGTVLSIENTQPKSGGYLRMPLAEFLEESRYVTIEFDYVSESGSSSFQNTASVPGNSNIKLQNGGVKTHFSYTMVKSNDPANNYFGFYIYNYNTDGTNGFVSISDLKLNGEDIGFDVEVHNIYS